MTYQLNINALAYVEAAALAIVALSLPMLGIVGSLVH